ncbi:MAG: flagellar biosynthesis protein FlhA [Deltaproteobacteria bacterium RBG_13_43_22]|nr:MAG: flagellar biosynthesis protein FlhA [Deltaproteobacteria bacterium RBG_13_43_22]
MSIFTRLQNKEGIFVAIALIGVLGLMLLPLPPLALDFFLSMSIALSVVILITSIFVNKPLDFSIFPSLLLLTTLFRLSLNIATTKLVLLRGNEGIDAAGQVVKSFGNFVVSGNYTVGIIIFTIIVVINFVVITKGAGRIAEVAARFTLDAMPGKQMAIDADLNSGLIDETEARRRRSIISQEADFYGAMDGASKFVRGDAIAGLVITGINILGGFIIGVLQLGLPFGEAAKTYTLLTVGDGLVSQIPALLVSSAAGIVVSRAGSESDLGKDLTRQLLVNPKTLATTSAVLFVFGLIPGLPHVPFLMISAIMGGMAFFLKEQDSKSLQEEQSAGLKEEPQIESFLEVDPLTLEIGYGLIPLVEGEGELLNKIKGMRRQLAGDLGFVVPPIHIKDNLQLRPHEYFLLVKGIEIARGEILSDHWLAVGTGDAEKINGVPTKEPAFGLPALWIEAKEIEKAQMAGYMVVDLATVIATHITELLKKHGWELLTRSEVQSLLDRTAKTYPKIVDELIPSHMTLGGVQRVLQNLLREQVPIKDLVTILETLLDFSPSVKEMDQLTEHVRQSLSRYLTKQYEGQDGHIPVLVLDPRFEKPIYESIQSGGSISPDLISKLLRAMEKILGKGVKSEAQPVLVCSAHIRRFIRRFADKFLPSVAVLSNAEISPSAKLYTLGMVRYED